MKKIKDSEWQIICDVFREYRNGVNWKCHIEKGEGRTLKKYFKKLVVNNMFDYSKFEPLNYPKLYALFLNQELEEANYKLNVIHRELRKIYMDI